MTEKERQALSLLAKKLEISTDFASEIERSLKGKAYSKALQTKLSDGVLTKKEKYELQEIRNMLGLKEEQVREATKDSAIEAYRVIFRRFSENGLLNAVELDELKDLERSTNLTPAEAANISPDDAITLYRRTVSIVCQDGIVTAEEEKLIDALEYLLQLPKKLTAPLKEQIEMVRELHQLRSGKLPIIRKDGLHLKSTELCHWYSSCCYQYKTPTRLIELYGDLIVTSRRIIFSSPERSIEFSIKKILNIYSGSDGVKLNLTCTRGQGVYLVNDAEKLAAIIEALVRHHNFLMAERLDSARCRHIPDDVKVAVWQRDGGRCVKCKAIDYIEFDHIIPFSKGGANTVGNIQLLCRRCNLAKGGELL
jgi:hypothetical protein